MFKSLLEKKLELLGGIKLLGVRDLTQEYNLLDTIFLYNKLPPKKSMSNQEYEDYLKSNEYKDRNEQLDHFKQFLMSSSKHLKDGEEQTFSLRNGEYLYFINNQYITTLNEAGIAIFSSSFEPLFYFSIQNINNNNIADGFHFGNYSYLGDYSFTFKKPIGNDSPFFQFNGKDISFILDEKYLNIYFKASIKKISMKDDNYVAHFSENLYSNITLNKNFDIVDVSISKALKNKLNIDLKINAVQTYAEISQKIHSHIKDDLELYTLINDKKIKLKGSQEQFDQDMLIFKESIKYIKNIESFYQDNVNFFNKAGALYLDIKDYIISNDKDSQTAIRVLNNINILEKYKKDNKNFINNEIFSDIIKTIEFSNKFIKFTNEIDLTKKRVKKTKQQTIK